ncbi:MAG: formylglycine-generating enzyme family protein [Candidatus Brocadiia bacterium]
MRRLVAIVALALSAGLCACSLHPGESTPVQIELISNPPFPLIRMEPGSFLMGSDTGGPGEKPVHRVTIGHAFYMGATEVTQAQYKAVMNANPSQHKGDDLPVEFVSHGDARNFCRELTDSELAAGRLPSGLVYRLPTEAEWEYACRAGSASDYCFGDDVRLSGDYAWFEGNAGDAPHAVGTKKPNSWGLYDMYGNVSEWCEDTYEPDGRQSWREARAIADKRVSPTTDWNYLMTLDLQSVRGGDWSCTAKACRSASRGRQHTSTGWAYPSGVGLRVVAGLPIPQEKPSGLFSNSLPPSRQK